METVLTIGDFSRMTHLSIKALRHYHDVGVLEPASVDRFTGYRSYDTSQVPTAQIIRRLRTLQMPLDQIRSVLAAPDEAARNREIAAHLARMERQLEETQAAVATLRALLQGGVVAPAVSFRRVRATWALAIEETVDASDLIAWGSAAFAEIAAVRASLGTEASTAPGGLFPGDFFELERARLTLFQPVRERPGAAREPGGRVRWREIPAADLATVTHEGALTEIDRAYAVLGEAVAARGIGAEGELREYFVAGPNPGGEAARRTEVGWPVRISAEEPRIS